MTLILQSKIPALVILYFSMKAIAGYLRSLFDREFVFPGLKTALLVGTILFTINHGGALLRGEMDRERWVSGLLTYLMPYCVNVHGQYIARRSSRQIQVNESKIRNPKSKIPSGSDW